MSDPDNTPEPRQEAARPTSRYRREAVEGFVAARYTDQNAQLRAVEAAFNNGPAYDPSITEARRTQMINLVGGLPDWAQVMTMESDNLEFSRMVSPEAVGHFSASLGSENIPTLGRSFAAGPITWADNYEGSYRVATHELMHYLDRELGRANGANSYFSDNPQWLAAVERDAALARGRPHTPMYDGEIRDVWSRIAGETTATGRAAEALAEIGSHQITMRSMGMSEAQIDEAMRRTYPNMWDNFNTEFVPAANRQAARLVEVRARTINGYIETMDELAELRGEPPMSAERRAALAVELNGKTTERVRSDLRVVDPELETLGTRQDMSRNPRFVTPDGAVQAFAERRRVQDLIARNPGVSYDNLAASHFEHADMQRYIAEAEEIISSQGRGVLYDRATALEVELRTEHQGVGTFEEPAIRRSGISLDGAQTYWIEPLGPQTSIAPATVSEAPAVRSGGDATGWIEERRASDSPMRGQPDPSLRDAELLETRADIDAEARSRGVAPGSDTWGTDPNARAVTPEAPRRPELLTSSQRRIHAALGSDSPAAARLFDELLARDTARGSPSASLQEGVAANDGTAMDRGTGTVEQFNPRQQVRPEVSVAEVPRNSVDRVVTRATGGAVVPSPANDRAAARRPDTRTATPPLEVANDVDEATPRVTAASAIEDAARTIGNVAPEMLALHAYEEAGHAGRLMRLVRAGGSKIPVVGVALAGGFAAYALYRAEVAHGDGALTDTQINIFRASLLPYVGTQAGSLLTGVAGEEAIDAGLAAAGIPPEYRLGTLRQLAQDGVLMAQNAYEMGQRRDALPAPIVGDFVVGMRHVRAVDTADPALNDYLQARDAALALGHWGEDMGARVGRVPVSQSRVDSMIDAAARQYLALGGTLETAQFALTDDPAVARATALVQDIMSTAPGANPTAPVYRAGLHPQLERLTELKAQFERSPTPALFEGMGIAAAEYIREGHSPRDALFAYYRAVPFAVSTDTITRLEGDRLAVTTMDGSDGTTRDGRITTRELGQGLANLGVYNSTLDANRDAEASFEELRSAYTNPAAFRDNGRSR